jgi:hypothetical protein
MEDSDTYLMIIEQGCEKEAKSVLLRQGTRRFGAPDETISTQLSAITDLERLHRLEERVLDASTWQELLDTP